MIVKRLNKIDFIQATSILISGTIFGHLITAATLPILTRLYSPRDFTVLASFSGIVSIISVAACLRFDIAIPLPKSDKDGINLFSIAIVSGGSVAIFIVFIITIASEQAKNSLIHLSFLPWLWMLPIGVFLTASNNALQAWLIRKKQFKVMAYSRITQSAIGPNMQIALGSIGLTPIGLLIGYLVSLCAACLLSGYALVKSDWKVFSNLKFSIIGILLKEYSHFPKYSTLEALCNTASIQIPIVMLAGYSIQSDAGHLMLAMTIVQAPMVLIGTAISQVYLSQAPEQHREKRLDAFTDEILGGLIRTGIGPLLFLGIISPKTFSLVFGEEWQHAGYLVSWMVPWFIMQFLVSPISMSLHVTGRQRTALILQIVILFIRVVSVWLGISIALEWAAEIYAISGFIVYFIYFTIISNILNINLIQIMHHVKRNSIIILAWIIIGSIFAKVISISNMAFNEYIIF